MTTDPSGGSGLVLAAGRVVTAEAVLRPGWVRVADGLVAESGAGAPPSAPDVDLGDATVVPGFVDLHVHGGGGRSFTEAADPGGSDAVRGVVDLHRRHGTTRTLASLVSAPHDVLVRQVRALAGAVDDGLVAGIHLEGPWLAASRCGAHDPAALRHPDPAEVEALLEAGRGVVRMVTLAPELPGALGAIEAVVAAGAVAAVGHTDATYDETRAAIDAGARVATHLFNAMRPVHHREPGAVVALLEDERVVVELVADGVHLHPATYRWAARRAGADRVALVTDAMAAAGMPDGRYAIGDLPVTVTEGVARLDEGGAIAGSTATTDAGFRLALARATEDGDDGDAALLTAVRRTSVAPARAVGLPVAALRPGDAADLVVLDDRCRVVGVVAAGVWRLAPES